MAETSANRTFVLSHEELSGHHMGRGGVTQVYPDLERRVKFLDKAFHNADLEICAYTREHEDWLNSIWAQAILWPGYTGNWDEFRTTMQCDRTLAEIISDIQDILPNRQVYEFSLERDARSGLVGGGFLTFLGLPSEMLDSLIRP